MNKKQLATEGAEIAAGAGLVGTDLGAGAGGAVEAVGVFLYLLSIEHHIYLVAPTAVLQSRRIYL